jgi:hypothetical protein
MKTDHLNNPLHLRIVDRFNRVSLPQDIFNYLRERDMNVGMKESYSSFEEDMCTWYCGSALGQDRGFLINRFSSLVLTATALNVKLFPQRRYLSPENHARSRVAAFSDKMSLSDRRILTLPKYEHVTPEIEKREVVIRHMQHGSDLERGMVQILDKVVWNKRFPNCQM